jgi:hypothetical protein
MVDTAVEAGHTLLQLHTAAPHFVQIERLHCVHNHSSKCVLVRSIDACTGKKEA